MSRKPRAESELRKQIERILNAPVLEAAWRYAVGDRMVSQVLIGESSPQWLATKLRELMAIQADQPRVTPEFIIPRRRQRRAQTTLGRREAVSEALAGIARQGDDLRNFRRTVLHDRLLRFEEVEDWIQEHRSDETYPHALIVRIKKAPNFDSKKGWHLEAPLCIAKPDQIEDLAPVDCLAYARKGDRWAQKVPIGRDGTLRTLWRLSKSLASTFRWQASQATMFLLTDMTPLITDHIGLKPAPMITLPWGGLLPLACLTRINLEIDPLMTPKELAQKFGRIRAGLLGRKPRAQSPKHMQLAVFAVNYPSLNKEAMTKWGSLFPEWKYTRVSLFARDGRNARSRLLLEHPVDLWGKLGAEKLGSL